MSFQGDERVSESLDDRVATVGHDELIAFMEMRLVLVGDRCGLREPGEDVERGRRRPI